MVKDGFGQIPMDDDRVKKYGANQGKGLVVKGNVSTRQLGGELARRLRQLDGVCRQLEHWAVDETQLVGGVAWLLENGYLAQREGRWAVHCLEQKKTLRKCGQESLLIVCARGAIFVSPQLDQHRLALYLEGFQREQPLTEEELASFVPALVCALVERLMSLCGDHRALVSNQVEERQFEAIFQGLRAIGAGEWNDFLEGQSIVDQLLRRDPSGVYANMEASTRHHYRQALCRLAQKRGVSQIVLAQEILRRGEEEGRHIGYDIFPQNPNAGRLGGVYGGVILLATTLLTATVAWMLQSWMVAFLLVFPISDLVKNFVDFLVVRLIHPRPICRMALEEGIPTEGRTLCVIAALITRENDGQSYAHLLERYFLANRDSGGELRLGLLADLPDSDSPMTQGEKSRIDCVKKEIVRLNKKYGQRFYLLFRQPSFNEGERRYQGWERKRGALLELNRLLLGKDTGLRVEVGEARWLTAVRYVITLDGDTALTVGSAREMVGAMLHPLNQPVLDLKRNVVVEGYGLLQPRVSVGLRSANRTTFSRIYGGQGGIDPYGSTASEVYHDLFNSGSYTGKGIYHVEMFHRCLDGRFPDNTVLSHDLLEGAYLHCGLLSQVELTDGFPSGIGGYFLRLHRWVRGDWQLLPWLGARVPNGAGGVEENPLSLLSRWKIFDNLRRSVSPLFTLVALVLGICFSDLVFAVAGGVDVVSAASNLLLSGVELAARRGVSTHVRYHSNIIMGLAGTILQTVLQLILLPYQAYITTHGAITALYRSIVSKKKRLEWVTAAEQEGKKGQLFTYYRRQWFAVLVGLITAVGANVRIGGLVGAIWMLSPLLSWHWSRPVKDKKKLAQGDRTFLRHQAGLIWGYFHQFLTEDDHFLPPDNWQEQPSVGLARRTSPTNIGMALLSIVAAVDLELIPRAEGAELVERMVNTIEGMEKWHGHLYNWYDTSTATPLSPRYVSTVDSGNFCGCLIALEAVLEEWKQKDLMERVGRLAQNMEFAPLYDREKKLFSIGWEEELGRLTQGWYDLMASEARQTSYIAVARGEVEPRHWRKLGRMMVGENDYRGMASWTGTMFEYFMPNLLLPWEENSLMYESLCFCVYAQRKRAKEMGAPWGISESGFYAFDQGMNYQYKAHGVQALGLKRGLNQQLVVAPYATFLAMLVAPKSGIENLKRLSALGAQGLYGFYEGVDYTASRLEGDAPFALVRSYMSHHLGMSLVAVDNVLMDNIMQRRFMSNHQMGAFRELLQERVPMGAPVLKQRDVVRGDAPKPQRPAPLQRRGEGASRLHPSCHLLSSGGYHVLCCDSGLTQSKLGDCSILRGEFGSWYAPSGISAVFVGGEDTMGLTAAPFYGSDTEYRWEYHGGGAVWHGEKGNLHSRISISVPEGENGELRRINLHWEGERPLDGELLVYLEPMLAKEKDFLAHPVFSKLFLESAQLENGVAFHRRPREREQMPTAVILWSGAGVSYTTTRETGLGRGGLRGITARQSGPLDGAHGEQTDPCLMLRMPIHLTRGQEQTLQLAVSVSDHLNSAHQGAKKILRGEGGHGQRMAVLSARLGLEERGVLGAMELLGRMVAYIPPKEVEQSQLWQYGISGDLPIALCQVEDGDQALVFCKQHQLLNKFGFQFDLVLLVEEGGDYRQPISTAIREGIKEMDGEHALGAKGGVHLLKQGAELLLQWGCVPLPLEEVNPEKELPPPAPVSISSGDVRWEYDEENHVIIHTGERLPPLGWSQLLCNEHFGWMTDESGNGFLWEGNSREGRLTKWANDPLAVGGEERIILQLMGREFSLFADGDGLSCDVTYGFGTATWEKNIGGETLKTEGFVPWNENRRLLTITWTGGVGRLCYHLGDVAALSTPISRNQSIVLETIAREGRSVTRICKGAIPERRETEGWWRSRVAPIEVETPDEGLNHYLNGWALYQVLACRLFARTSQYQNGGAYGFRDQLQDVCALLYTDSIQARAQLLRASSRQFEEGDVQHWWHPPKGAGVRTRITDDLLWLPYVLARYVEVTGDWEICNEKTTYLKGPPLGQGEQERYDIPEISCKEDTLYNHCMDAIRCFIRRGLGSHGLPLMGAGDWNDGMNRVGGGGRGESLWLAWFSALVMERFQPISKKMGDGDGEALCKSWGEKLIRGAEESWDGKWYRRGYFDDGSPLGAEGNNQCAIDSLAQSFSTFVVGSNPDRARQGVMAAVQQLYDPEDKLVRLFTPPFNGTGRDPGYIRGYLPGVRENGGQYTHGGVWLARACLVIGEGERWYRLMSDLLPVNHNQQIYRGEPYVLAADVYATKHHRGRAGWTWYTGAAGWYYQTAIENLLGITIRDKVLTIAPNIPESWRGYQVKWTMSRETTLKIEVKRTGLQKIILDGAVCPQGIPLEELKGDHNLTVEI